MTVNTTFPKGVALAQWLAGPAVNASTTLGQITTGSLEHTVTAVNPPATEWLYLLPSAATMNLRAVQHMSFQTPSGMPEANQCGKVMFTDMHVQASAGTGGGDDSDPSKPFPTGCKTNESTAAMKAMEFLFFDLAACL